MKISEVLETVEKRNKEDYRKCVVCGDPIMPWQFHNEYSSNKHARCYDNEPEQ